MLPILLIACSAGPKVLPDKVVLSGDGRLTHTRSGATWADPDVEVGPVVWVRGQSEPLAGELRPGRSAEDEIAAYLPGSTAEMTLRMGDQPLPGSTVTMSGRWASGAEIQAQTLPLAQELSWSLGLPQRLDALELTLEFSEPEQPTYRTHHTIVTTWDAPIEGTPLYRRPLLWMAQWGAGTPAKSVTPLELQAQVENDLALVALDGIWELGLAGERSYGPFPRPKDKDNQAHVWLDHGQSACGEYRGILLNLLESQGVEASWVLLTFRNPSPDALSMYETRKIAAVGTEPKVWQHWNHVAVEVNGQVYDPTYHLHHPDFASYEDDLFEFYCTGEDEKCKTPGGWCQQPRPEGSCRPNPPGFDPSGPEGAMLVKRGDNY